MRNFLVNELKQAIKHKAIKAMIQPIYSDEKGCIIGGEVLARWQHESLGNIPTEIFITTAKKYNLSGSVTEIIFNDAAEKIKRNNLLKKNILFISFNLGAEDFESKNILRLCTLLKEEPNINIVLEITEQQNIADTEFITDLINELHYLNVSFAIDDFGTGYSNYHYLQKFSPKYIKIDKSFTVNLENNKTNLIIINHLVLLSAALGCELIAEGIENETQYKILKSLGVKFFQGYYFSAAIDIDVFFNIACN